MEFRGHSCLFAVALVLAACGPSDAAGGNPAAPNSETIRVPTSLPSVPDMMPDVSIPTEVRPDNATSCFPGAFYRKLASSHDLWTGIDGVVVLGKPQTDPARVDPQTGLPLDNFSVYLGGNAGLQEIDAGLTWDVTKDAAGNVSAQRNAFRPFWRNESWHNAPAEDRYYWHPGDRVHMAVTWTAPGRLHLLVADAEPGHGDRQFNVEFDAVAWTGTAPRQFKRVNAIDQVDNEGKLVQPTLASITGCTWLQTSLRRGGLTVPLTPARVTDMRCPAANILVRTTPYDASRGAESVDLIGH